MVRSESADEEFMLSSGKVSGNEEDDEYAQWTHSSRRASSSCRGGEDDTSPNGVSCSLGGGDELSDRRIRRQIANCNERRRMQSINAGFQNLRSLLPKRDGEKMSKAAILQHTAELIQSLQAEKMRLLEEKEAAIQAKKRRIEDEEARERGLVDELTVALEQERRLRQLYEQQLRERRERETMLSPISAPTAPPLPSSIVDSSLIRPRTDIPGLLPHAMAIEGLVSGSRYVHLDTPVHPASSFASSVMGVDCGGVTCNQTSAATVMDSVPQAPLLMNSMENHSTANLSHRNLNAILEAIRHLEGGTMMVTNSPPPQAQHSNVLVR
uniref:Transcription factor AP-4 n=1 Tax=Ascaris suum TaxID=6253 RepID=F1KZV0_ASCSU